jgi:hypothetical protein
MSGGLTLAAGSLVALAVLHSALGERLLLGPLLAAPSLPPLRLPAGLARQTLRFAWHLTSLAWLGLAWILVAEPRAVAPVGAVLGASGLVALLGSRGRHFAWAVFLAGALGAAAAALPPGAGGPAVARGGAVVLGLVAGLHLAWSAGLRWGVAAAVPEVVGRPAIHPPGWLTVLVALALLVAAALLLALGTGGRPAPWVVWGGGAAGVAFGVRTLGDLRLVGLFKRVGGTAFARWDSLLYTPLCFALSAAFAWVLLATP